MDTVLDSQAAPQGRALPSLLGNGHLASSVSILDAVDVTPKRRSGPRWPLVVGVALPAVAAMIGWQLWTTSASSPQAAVVPAPPVVRAAAPASATPAPADKPPEPVAVTVAAAPAAPVTVASTNLGSATPSVAEPAPITPAAAPTPAVPLRPPTDVLLAPSAQASPATPAPKPTAAKTNRPVNAAKESKTAGAKPEAPRAVAERTVPARKDKASDPDVELINAIMRHVNSQTSEKQTIAALVKQCMHPDDIESLMCRRRICEGSWGQAQACPMHLAPRSVRAQNQP